MAANLPLDALRELVRHMEWADAAVWRVALGHAPALSDARLRDLLRHLHGVQRGFLNVWTSQPMSFPTAEDLPDLAAVHAWSLPYYADVNAYVETLDDSDLGGMVEMPWLAEFERQQGRRFEKPTLGETLFQVTSHSTYHRGQVNVRLRELGAVPPLVDYIAWIWFGRPQAEWVAPTSSSG